MLRFVSFTPFVFVTLALLLTPTSGLARDDDPARRAPRLELLSVSVASHLKQKHLKHRLQKLLQRELDRRDVRPSGVFSLRVALVELNAHERRRGVETECVVSASVHEGADGALFAILRGKGRVHSQVADADAAELALRAAVSGALDQVAEAVAR